MRILLVNNLYQIAGGEASVVRDELRLLREYGHDVFLLEADNRDIVTHIDRLKTAATAVYSFQSKKRVAAMIASFGPHVVHVHNTFPKLSPAVYYACHDARIPVVQTLHNYRLLCANALLFRDGKICEDCLRTTVPWPGVLRGCYRNSQMGTLAVAGMIVTHRLLRTWQRKVSMYIVLTEFARKKFVAGGLPAEKIVVKPNFIDPDPGYGRGNGGYVLFAGRLAEEKGLRTLLSAWQQKSLPCRLKIAGGGPLEAEVQRRHGGEIEFIGSKSSTEIFELMGEASALVVPSECYEGMPRIIVESFAKGTPVIGSKLGAMESMIEHQRTGLHFEAGNSTDLATQVQWMLTHNTEWQQMRREARAEYEAKYTGAKNYEILRAIYERAVQAPKPCREPILETQRYNGE